MADIFFYALGKFGQSSLWPQRLFGRDLDLASLSSVPRHAAGYEG